ncbi:MAG: adenosine kinase [Parvibaculales bacterium]
MSDKMLSERPLITGMGAALVDLFADVDEPALEALGSPKGSMTLVDAARANALRDGVKVHTYRPGGSAANTVAGLAGLGMQGGFIGKIGDDELGRVFRDSLTDLGVTFPVTPCDATDHPTGNCLVLVTPDAERTMHTLLGASVTTATPDLDDKLLDATGILFCEGYVWDSPTAREAFLQAAARVKSGGGRIGFSLSDTFCVARHKQDFLDLFGRDIDILLANFAEAQALLDVTEMADITAAMQKAGVDGAITCGAEGAVIVCGDAVVHVDAHAVETVTDLTGAGDQFAAGYLCGVARGRDAQTCGRMGALAAAEVIQHFGPRPEKDLRAVFAEHGL